MPYDTDARWPIRIDWKSSFENINSPSGSMNRSRKKMTFVSGPTHLLITILLTIATIGFSFLPQSGNAQAADSYPILEPEQTTTYDDRDEAIACLDDSQAAYLPIISTEATDSVTRQPMTGVMERPASDHGFEP
jgi:hypothetical protein